MSGLVSYSRATCVFALLYIPKISGGDIFGVITSIVWGCWVG